MMHSVHLEIDFEFCAAKQQCMTVHVHHQHTTKILCPAEPGIVKYETKMFLPNSVSLEFSGKDMNHDTVLDNAGNIIEDKAVIIRRILIDRLPVDKNYLEKHLVLETASGNVNSNYAGFNGKMVLNFNQPNAFLLLHRFYWLGTTK